MPLQSRDRKGVPMALRAIQLDESMTRPLGVGPALIKSRDRKGAGLARSARSLTVAALKTHDFQRSGPPQAAELAVPEEPYPEVQRARLPAILTKKCRPAQYIVDHVCILMSGDVVEARPHCDPIALHRKLTLQEEV